MTIPIVLVCLLLLASAGFYLARSRALSVSGGNLTSLSSLPGHYGAFTAAMAFVPGLAIVALWTVIGQNAVDAVVLNQIPAEIRADRNDGSLLNQVHNQVAAGGQSIIVDAWLSDATSRYVRLVSFGRWLTWAVALAVASMGLLYSFYRIRPDFQARSNYERFVRGFLILCSTLSVLTTLGIVLSLLFESVRFFARVPIDEFLFGLQWSPQTALREDQVGGSGTFGSVPLFTGTLLISFIAMLVAVPIGLMSAVYMTQYASSRARQIAKPVLEILAGVPTVVYGFFAALQVAPFVRGLGESIGLDVASESALAAGLVMGIMIIPFMSSLSDDAISAVPQAMRDGSYGLGATKSETIRQVLLPAALPGIMGAFLLAVSRAIGETMIVVMAAGLAANLSVNPLDAVTTVTAQIVALLTGDQEFDSAKTLSAFALGFVLFLMTLLLNIAAVNIVRKYREIYE